MRAGASEKVSFIQQIPPGYKSGFGALR